MTFWLKRFCSLGGLLAAPVLLVGTTAQCQMCPPSSVYDTSSSANEASTLLQEMRIKAIHVRDLAGQLESFDRDAWLMSRQADAGVLTKAKAQFNAMDEMLYRLRVMRPQALPWQQKAIDRVAPKLIELTDYVQAAIRNLNTHHITVHILDKSYMQDAANIYQRANTIAPSIGQYEEYAAAGIGIQQLRPKLGMKVTS